MRRRRSSPWPSARLWTGRSPALKRRIWTRSPNSSTDSACELGSAKRVYRLRRCRAACRSARYKRVAPTRAGDGPILAGGPASARKVSSIHRSGARLRRGAGSSARASYGARSATDRPGGWPGATPWRVVAFRSRGTRSSGIITGSRTRAGRDTGSSAMRQPPRAGAGGCMGLVKHEIRRAPGHNAFRSCVGLVTRRTVRSRRSSASKRSGCRPQLAGRAGAGA